MFPTAKRTRPTKTPTENTSPESPPPSRPKVTFKSQTPPLAKDAHARGHRLILRQPDVDFTRAGLSKVCLTPAEREINESLVEKRLHYGRYFPETWYKNREGLEFFDSLVDFQKWNTIIQFHGPSYPIELVQFFASLKHNKGNLVAMVNGKSVEISYADIIEYFHVPGNGLAIYSGLGWNSVSADDKEKVENFFARNTDVAGNILTKNFSAPLKILTNLIFNTLVPRRGGREKLNSYEAILLHALLEGTKVNLPLLIIHRIHHVSKLLLKQNDTKNGSTYDLPYGMWISHILDKKGVVDNENYGVGARDVMSNTLMSQMWIEIVGRELRFKEKDPKKSIEKVANAAENYGLKRVTPPIVAAPSPEMISMIENLQITLANHSKMLTSFSDVLQSHGTIIDEIRDSITNQGEFQRQMLSEVVSKARHMREDGEAILTEAVAGNNVLKTVCRVLTSNEPKLDKCLNRLDTLEYKANRTWH